MTKELDHKINSRLTKVLEAEQLKEQQQPHIIAQILHQNPYFGAIKTIFYRPEEAVNAEGTMRNPERHPLQYLCPLGLPPQALPQLLVLVLIHLFLPLLLHTVGPKSGIRLARFKVIRFRFSQPTGVHCTRIESPRKAWEDREREIWSRTLRRLPAQELLERTGRRIEGIENVERRELVRRCRAL